MIYQLYYDDVGLQSCFKSDLYEPFDLRIAEADLPSDRFRPCLCEWAAILYFYHHHDKIVDDWIGFTSFRQDQKGIPHNNFRVTAKHLVGFTDPQVLTWGILDFGGTSVGQQLDACFPGVCSVIERVWPEELPKQWYRCSSGIFCNYWALRKSAFLEYMSWAEPRFNRLLEALPNESVLNRTVHRQKGVPIHAVGSVAERMINVWAWIRNMEIIDLAKRPGNGENLISRPPDEIVERQDYQEAGSMAVNGRFSEARARYRAIEALTSSARQKAMIQNDLAAISAVDGDVATAIAGFQAALSLDADFTTARENLELLQAYEPPAASERIKPAAPRTPDRSRGSCKVAVLSFLFNWPTTAGGIFHTVELVQALEGAGYETRHFYLRDHEGLVGHVKSSPPIRSEAIQTDKGCCTLAGIKASFRRAVQEFDPDCVIIMDSWNFKPHLADAVGDYPYLIQLQAMECLCPLNNLRLLVTPQGKVSQCPVHQLAMPDACMSCLQANSSQSGGLHRWERSLSDVGSTEYRQALYRAFANAAAVLVLNPLVAEMVRPYAKRVEIVPWGMDPARFPWPFSEAATRNSPRKKLLMAGVVNELIKGFHILHEACALLWRKRKDFELLATGGPAGQLDEFTRLIGWQSQADLPRCIREADILLMPTIAQEGLGRTTVEAMGVGRPVIASRIGGLPYTVSDGLTGLLAEPGNAHDLAEKIERLLDDPILCTQMGEAGRKRFESDFTWSTIIERHYRPILQKRNTRSAT